MSNIIIKERRNMKPKAAFLVILLGACVLLFSASGPARVGPTYAIVGCTVVPVSAPPLENGVIIVRSGLIESLGPAEKVAVPEDAEVIEAKGLFAYPGLIDALSSHFLEVPKEERPAERIQRAAMAEPVEKDWAEQVAIMAFKLLKPKKADVENLHRAGITTVLVAPERSIYAGQSVLLNVNGEEIRPMVIRNPVALHVHFATERRIYPSSLMGTMAFLRQSFMDAEHYSLHKTQFLRSSLGVKRPEYDPYLEALLPYVVEKKPVFFHCANQEDIKRAIRLIKEFRLTAVLSGANEAWRVASLVKEANVPLLITLDFRPPSTSIYARQDEETKKKAEEEVYPANAARLHQEGISFGLVSLGLRNASAIPSGIQKALKAGMPGEQALKAMTIIPARLLGVSGFLGSLEPGKAANIVLTDGEIFAEKTKVKRVFVDGLSFDVKEPPRGTEAATVNVSGKWKATVSGPMGEMEMTVDLVQEGNAVSGLIFSDFGRWEISDGMLSGKSLSFLLSVVIMGETMEMSFIGTAEKDTLEGTISFEGGSARLRATRIPDQEL